MDESFSAASRLWFFSNRRKILFRASVLIFSTTIYIWVRSYVESHKISLAFKKRYWLRHLSKYVNETEAIVRAIINPAHTVTLIFSVGFVVVAILWLLPKWQVSGSLGLSSKNRFDRENEARKTLAQIIGGIFLLAGLYSSVKTFDLQRHGADNQREGQITDRYTKAIDQLGAVISGKENGTDHKIKVNIEVRLGGIYALERIAHDSSKDHWTIMEVLTAYVRENAPRKNDVPRRRRQRRLQWTITKVEPVPFVRADIQAALTVIGRHNTLLDPLAPYGHVDLHQTDLRGAVLYDAHLENADLNSANLSTANMFDAHLSGIHLESAFLNGVNLNEAELNNAVLVGASLRRSSLINTVFTGAVLAESDLYQADLTGAILVFADLSNAVNLKQEQLIDARGNSATKLPSGLVAPTSWSK